MSHLRSFCSVQRDLTFLLRVLVHIIQDWLKSQLENQSQVKHVPSYVGGNKGGGEESN